MQQIDKFAMAVANLLQEQNAATKEISRNVTSVAQNTKLVVSVLNEVADGTHQAQRSIEGVVTASASVENVAEEMHAEAEDFLNNVAI
jgi:methyl-accepting chemotaxis protein